MKNIVLPYSHLSSKELIKFLGSKGFYGFGNLYGCKYLFIGPEFGGHGSTFATKAWIKAWKALAPKSGPCVDARKFFHRIEEYRWCGSPGKPNSPIQLQKTYGTLIALLPQSSFDKMGTREEQRKNYQRTKFGRLKGDDCFVEVSAIQRKSMKEVWPAGHLLSKAQLDQLTDARKKVLIDAVCKNKKLKLVVIYGIDTLDSATIQKMQKCRPGLQIVSDIHHPAYHVKANYFPRIATKIRENLKKVKGN